MGIDSDNREQTAGMPGIGTTLCAILVAVALWLGAALLLPTGSAASPASSADVPGTLRILPSGAGVEAGRTVTVEIWLDGGANYYGMDVRLSFDPGVVRVQSGRVVPLWDVLDPVNHFTIKNAADNVNGSVWYAVTNMNPAEAFTGTGRICAIAFTGVSSGSSQLHLTYAKGSTRSGEGLYPALVDGMVTVTAPTRYWVLVPLVLRDHVGL